MIISRRHKFIFFKTSKTAGTSVELALSPYLGPHDIITPVSPEDEIVRSRLGGRAPQHYRAPLWQYTLADVKKLLLSGERKMRFFNHIDAKTVKALIDPAEWQSYYKFVIERNPWDKVISHYYWVYRNTTAPSLSTYTQSKKIARLKRRSLPLYSIDGELAVDKICRHENLESDLEEVRRRIGLPTPLALPSAKSAHREAGRNYRELIDSEDRRRIAQVFSDEIALLGYEF